MRRTVRSLSTVLAVLALVALWGPPRRAAAAEPVNRDLIPEARAVLEYLHGVYGKRTVSGVSGMANAEAIHSIAGRYPAVLAIDISGWNSPTWGKSYCGVVESYLDQVQAWWADGGIVSMQYHWKNPAKPDGKAWQGKPPRGSGPFDLDKALRPGTAEHQAVLRDLRKTGDYLERLLKARVPVLWRPLHEIDGGWFWWTDADKPENTAALWRLMFDYFVHERKLNHLIWVYSAGLKPPRGRDVEQIDVRRRFYPGTKYVDISGIDIYANSYYGWDDYRDSAYRKAFDIMRKVSPGKILALCESGAIPNPDLLAGEGPSWLYCLPWFVGGKANPPDYVRTCYTHRHMITRDQLPGFGRRNTPPETRVVSPADGASLASGDIRLRADARDREGKVVKVVFRRLPGDAWRNWSLRKRSELAEMLKASTVIGSTDAKPYTCIWRRAPRGFHSILAVATDETGAAGRSNIVRVSVGLKDLAHRRTVTCSTGEATAAAAVDGDPFTAWSSKKSDPQWLQVDLGSRQRVGGVMLLWTKAHARDYAVQFSPDGRAWIDAETRTNKRDFYGDADVVRLAPASARHVRIHATRRGTTWGGYSLEELRVYPSLPAPTE